MTLALLSSFVLAPALSVPVRVDGDGYLRFVQEGRIIYATSAVLTVRDGVLVSTKGPAVTPSVRIPANAISLEIDLEGNITAVHSGGRLAAGRFVLAAFSTPLQGENGFFTSAVRAKLGSPGEGAFGVIRSTIPSGTAVIKSPVYTKPSKPGEGGRVLVNAVTEAETDTLTLKDIAAIEGSDAMKAALGEISLGAPPAAGIDMAVTVTRIRALAKRAGYEPEIVVPTGAVIRRKAQIIPGADFNAAAIKAAQEKLGNVALTGPEAQIDFKAPMGEVELRGEGVVPAGSNVAVTIGIYVDGKRINSRNVTLKADATAGVKAGAIVKIIVKSAGVAVEMKGKAQTAGFVGQTITVVSDTGSKLTATVISADVVEVKI